METDEYVMWRVRNMAHGSSSKQPHFSKLLRKDPCSYCGLPKSGTVDHIVPLTHGGANNLSNMAGCCFSCNQSKSSTDLLTFLWSTKC